MISLLAFPCVIATILIIWFKSDVIIEYGKLLGLSKFLKIEEFEKKKDTEDLTLTYITFLRMTYNGHPIKRFFIRLITCVWCLTLWLSIFTGIYFHSLFAVFIIFIFSLILYGVVIKLVQ